MNVELYFEMSYRDRSVQSMDFWQKIIDTVVSKVEVEEEALDRAYS